MTSRTTPSRRIRDQRNKAAVAFLLAISAGAPACRTMERNSTYTVGPKPIRSELESAGLFELRQGVLAAVPATVLKQFSEELRLALDGKEFSAADKKPKVDRSEAGRTETSVGEVVTTPCIKSVTFGFTPGSPFRINSRVELCGLSVVVKKARAAFHPNGFPDDKPLVATVAEATIKDPGLSATLVVSMAAQFTSDGGLSLSEAKLDSGLEAIAGNDDWKSTVSWSGLEDSTGALGDRLNALRANALSGLMRSLSSYTRSSLEHAVVRTLNRSVARVNERGALRNGVGFAATIDRFSFAVAGQFTGLTSGVDGLALAGQVNIAANRRAADEPWPCRSQFRNRPKPGVVGFDALTGQQAGSSPADTDPRVVLPAPVVDLVLWQLLGDETECNFRIPLSTGQEGEVAIQWSQPFAIAVDDPKARFDGRDGAMITLTWPKVSFRLSREIVRSLEARGIQLSVESNGTALFELSAFRHAVRVGVRDGDGIVTPHPILEVLYEDDWKGLDRIDFGRISEHPSVRSVETSADRLRLVLDRLIAQLLALTVAKGGMVFSDGEGGKIEVRRIRAENNSLVLDVHTPNQIGRIEEAVRIPARSSLRARSLAARDDGFRHDWFVTQVGLPLADFEASLRVMFPGRWQCQPSETPTTIATPAASSINVRYTVCGPRENPEDVMELRWLSTGNEDARSTVRHLLVRNLRPLAGHDGMTTAAIVRSLGPPERATRRGPVLRLRWTNQLRIVEVSAFCSEASTTCGKDLEKTRIASLEVWAK